MVERTSPSRPASVFGWRFASLLAFVVLAVSVLWPQSLPSVTTKAQVRPAAFAAQRLPPNPTPVVSSCAPIHKVTFSEDKFLNSDWDASVLRGGESVPGYVATQVTGGGNPAEFRSVRITNAGVPFVHLLKGYTFDPATEGGIVSIDGSYDLKNQTRGGTPASFAILLEQGGTYFRARADSVAAARWTRFEHAALKATDFVNVERAGPRNPTFTCDGRPIRLGFVALPDADQKAAADVGVDNWSINFNTTCCSAVAAAGASAPTSPNGGGAVAKGPAGGAQVTSRCCCDDDSVPVNSNGQVVLPPETDPQTPVFEYVEQDMGEVSDLYPGADTTTDTWCQKFPCRPAVGGTAPAGADAIPEIVAGLTADQIGQQLGEWGQKIEQATKTAPNWKDPAAPDYTPPREPHRPEPGRGIQYAFGGRDIVFVHGLKLDHVFDRISGKQGATVNWKQPASFPADADNPEFYTGYYHNKAAKTWLGGNQPNMGGHIAEFLYNKGYRNRFLIVSYDCSERLDIAVRSVLAQIGDAMVYGKGVIDPLHPGAPVHDFGTPSFVIVSHSTGGPVTDVALSAAAKYPAMHAAYIPKYCKAHVSVQGAHYGSHYATAALAVSGDAGVVAPLWAANMFDQISQQLTGASFPATPPSYHAIAKSILVDLVPQVAQHYWGPFIRTAPVRTLTVVAAHPSAVSPVKHVLNPGFDDGVLNINTQVANPNEVALWPSGFRTDLVGVNQNFDLGVFGIGPNTQVGVSIGGSVFNFSVNISNNSLNSPTRAVGYYIDQKGDRLSNPANVGAFPQPFFFAAGATPYISPTGMLQSIAAEFPQGSGPYPLSASPLNRTHNIFSYLQSASDHFKGTHDQGPGGFAGFNGLWYANTPFAGQNGEHNFEETRVITDQAVYDPVPMPYGDNEPLLRPQNVPQVHEWIRGLRVTFTVTFFKKKKTWSLWVWKRRYHLLAGWETKRQFDYVYESVLKN